MIVRQVRPKHASGRWWTRGDGADRAHGAPGWTLVCSDECMRRIDPDGTHTEQIEHRHQMGNVCGVCRGALCRIINEWRALPPRKCIRCCHCTRLARWVHQLRVPPMAASGFYYYCGTHKREATR